MEEPAVDVDKKERHRSPNYPAVGLREAVDRVSKFYAVDGKAGAQPEIAAKHIGFGSAHGGAMSVLAALKRFGLVADISGRLVPTQAAIEIINLPPHDSRRKNALKNAALMPSIYQELVNEYRSSGLPAADKLEAGLKTYRRFNPKAVGGFVRDFLDTLDYAEVVVDEDVTVSDYGDTTAAASSETSSPSSHLVDKPPAGATPEVPVDSITLNTRQRVKRTYPFDISIPRSLTAELSISGEFRQEDLDRLRTQIGRLIENLQDAFQD